MKDLNRMVRRHGTPPRHSSGEGEEDLSLLTAQAGLTGQPAGGGGVISINHTSMVANTLREEMHAVRSDLKAKFNSMKIEFEIKMSGRKGTGHYESGSIETLIEKNTIIEQQIRDRESSMNDIKDIKEAIKDDEKIADMIKKYKEITMKDKDFEKLKDDLEQLDKAIDTIRQNAEEDMAEIKENMVDSDVENKVDAISSRMNDNNRMINDHNVHMKSLIKNLEDKIDDKFKDQFEKLKKLKEKFEDDYVMKEN